jgi:hypothetical protein
MTSPAPAQPGRTSGTAKGLRRLWRWLRTAAIVIILGLLAFRLLLLILLPTVISRAARYLGVDCRYSRMELSLLSTNAALWDVSITSKDGGQRLLDADYAYVNFSTLQLLRLRLVAWRLEADGVKTDLVRRADGTIPVLAPLSSLMSAAPGTASPPGKGVDFSPPLVVKAVRLHHIAARVRDETTSPPFETAVRLDLGVSHLGELGTPAAVEVELTSDTLFDVAHVSGEAAPSGQSLGGTVAFSVRGLHTDRVATYLTPLALAVDQRNIDASGTAVVSLQGSPATPGVVSGSARLSDVVVRAASETVATLKAAEADIAALSPSEVHLSALRLKEGVLRAERDADGSWRIASVSATGGPPTGGAPTIPAAATAAPAPARSFRWRIDDFTATACEASLLDRAVEPANTLALRLEEFKAAGLASNGPPEAKATFAARMSSPRLASKISASGEGRPFAPEPDAAATVEVDGINPEALAPYLHALGLESTMTQGVLRCGVHATLTPREGGSPRLGAVLEGITLQDGDRRLFEMGRVTVDGLSVDPASGAVELARLEGSGPALTVRRLANGRLELPGFTYAPRAAVPASGGSGPRAPAGAAASRIAIPPLRLGKITWGGVRIRFEDLANAGSSAVEIQEAGVEASGLVFDPRPGAPAAPPGTLRAWLRAPGLAERLEVSGTLAPAPGALTADLAIQGEGLDSTSLRPYLLPTGIEPTLKQGAVSLRLNATLAQRPAGPSLGAEVRDLIWQDGGQLRASVKEASVQSIEPGPDGVSIGAVRVSGVQTDVARTSDGSVTIAGTRFARVPPRVERMARQLISDPFPSIASIGKVSIAGATIDDVRLGWRDDAATSPVQLQGVISATLGPLGINQDEAPPSPFTLVLAADGLAQRVEVGGTLKVGGSGVAMVTKVRGQGLHAPGIAGYLPAGTGPNLDHGQFQVDLRASLRPADHEGLAASLGVDGLDYREAGSEAPLAKASAVSVEVERLDRVTGELRIKRVSAQGLAATASRAPGGTIAMLGLIFGRVAPSAEAAPPSPPAPAVSAQEIVAASREALPLVALDELDIAIDRVTFTDGARPDAAPISLTATTLKTLGPIRLFGDRPEEHPPIQVHSEGTIEPVVSRFVLSAKASPFAQRPTLEATLEGSGIEGAGIARAVPELAAYVDAAPLRDGQFQMSLEAEADVHRRGATGTDLSRGLDVDFTLNQTRLTLGANGPVLAGAGKIHGEKVRIEPATGNVVAKLVEINDVAGNAWRDEDGVHVLGVVVKSPRRVAPGAEAAPPASPPAEAAAPVAPSDEAAPQPDTSRPEIRIDRLAVSGIDFRFEDRVLTPHVTVPIVALDADIRGLSSLALERDRPIRFNVSVGAGKVSLPKPTHGGVLTGAVGDAGKVLRGEGAQITPESEEREVFSQCNARGSMSLYPPRGRIIASISGLELTAVRGVAQAAGASIGGGVFDGRVELKSRDDGRVDVRSKLVLTDLRYSEPAEGPVARFISLPVPLDVAIKAVEAPDGSITVPVELTLDERGLTTGKVVGAAAGAAGQILATAVASAPVKIVTGFASLVADTKGNPHWVDDEPIVLTYAPGVALLDAASQEKLAEVLRRARDQKKMQASIEHELGSADAEIASQRANPPTEVATALAEDLRARRSALVARREGLLVSANAAGMRLSQPGGPTAAELRTVDEQLADVEDALDELYDLLRPGADRLAARRTRSALLELADARLGFVRGLTDQLAGPAGAARVAIAAPHAAVGDTVESRLIIRTRHLAK